MKRVTLFLSLYMVLAAAGVVFTQENSQDIILAEKYFKEAQTLSEKDGGQLWGVPFYGPMLFVNPQTRLVIANQEDGEAYLKKDGPLFSGLLPNDVNIANTSLDWKGKHWTMVIWPLPEDALARRSLMMHELFHRIQDKIGLPASNPNCAHLDHEDARILLRLEWRELVGALQANKGQRRMLLEKALVLNRRRGELYPGADSLEAALMMNEGLAEYSGLRLSGAPDSEIVQYLKNKVDNAAQIPTFVRSFAYISGPLYGFLLDESGVVWRDKIAARQSLTGMAEDVYHIELPANLETAVSGILSKERNTDIVSFEKERERKRLEQLASLKEAFLKKPVLIIPLENMRIQFDPRNLVPLEGIGTVYPTLRISDTWGVLDVSGGALLSADWKKVLVPLPGDISDQLTVQNIKAPGWNLELKSGYGIIPIPGKKSYLLQKKK